MTELQNNLKRLQLIQVDSTPEQVSQLLSLVIDSIQSTQMRELKQSNMCLTKILCKIQLWYTRAYDRCFGKSKFNSIQFYSQHDRVLHDFSNLIIMVARTGWHRPVHDTLTSLSRTVCHNDCYIAVSQLCFTILTRLLADDQILQLFGHQLVDVLKSGTTCLINCQYNGLSCPGAIHFIKMALLRISSAHEQGNYSGIPGSGSSEITTQQLNDIVTPIGPKKPVNENVQISIQPTFNFNTAEEAVTKQKNNILDLTQTYQQMCSLLYFFVMQNVFQGQHQQIIQPGTGSNQQQQDTQQQDIYQQIINNHKQDLQFGKGIAELIETLIVFIFQLNIRLYKFASVPAGMLPFISQAKKARQAVELSNGDKKLQIEAQHAIGKLPNIKFLQKIREQCYLIAQQLLQVALRLLSFLNITNQASRFGHCTYLWAQACNLMLYVNKQIQYLQEEQEYSGMISKYVLGQQENLAFGLMFVIPQTSYNQVVKQYFQKIQLFPQQEFECHGQGNVISLDDSLPIDQKFNYFIQECRGYNEDDHNIFNFCNIYSLMYKETEPKSSISQHQLIQFIFEIEEMLSNHQLLHNYEYKFQIIKEALIGKSNCNIQQYGDNSLYIYHYMSLYQLPPDDSNAIQIISQLIYGMYKHFDLINYNIQSIVHVFVMLLVQTNSTSKQVQFNIKAIFEACKIFLQPLLAGFIYNYNALVYQKTAGNLAQSNDITYNTCNLSGYYTFQCGLQNAVNQLIKEEIQVDKKTIVTSTMSQSVGSDVVRFEPKLIISAIIQTINFILNNYNESNDIYKLASSICNNQVKKQKVQYLLNQIIGNFIIITFQKLELFDHGIIDNITQLLFLLFTKINQFNPFSQTIFIKQVYHQQQLTKSIERYLLAQTQQDLQDEQQRMDNFITLLYMLKTSQPQQTEPGIIDFIGKQIDSLQEMYLPLKIIIRSVINQIAQQLIDEQFDNTFKPNDYAFSNDAFYQILSKKTPNQQIYHIIAMLFSYLYEYKYTTEDEKKQHFYSIIQCIFNKKNGLLSKVYNQRQDNNQLELPIEDQLIYAEELMYSYLSKYYSKNKYTYILNFVNNYLIMFAQKYEIDLETSCGAYLDETLIMENQLFRTMFYQTLGYNSIVFRNAKAYSYILTQLIVGKSSDQVEYMLRHISSFDNNIDPNIVIPSVNLSKYQIQLYVIQYLQSRSYYIDHVLLNKLLNNVYKNYYEVLMYRPGLANYLYNINDIILEQILPVSILQAQLNMLTPLQYIQIYQNIKFDTLLQRPYQCNIIHQSIHGFAQNVNHLTIKIQEKNFGGVINGDKDSCYYLSLENKYFQDLRVIENQATQAAIKLQHGKQVQNIQIQTLSDIATLQYLLGTEIIIKNISEVSFDDVLKYLDVSEVQYTKIQEIQPPKYVIKCYQYESIALDQKITGSIKDFIPPQLLILYSDDWSGYSDSNTYSTKKVDSQSYLDRITLNYQKTAEQYTDLSLQVAIQILEKAIIQQSRQTDVQKVIFCIDILFSLIEQQTYYYIKEHININLFTYIDYLSLMGEQTILLVSKTIYNIVFKLKQQKVQNVQILDYIFQRLTTSVIQYLQNDETHQELFSYTNNVIMCSINNPPHQYIPADDKSRQCIVDVLSQLLIYASHYNFFTSQTALLAKLSQQILSLNINTYLKQIVDFVSPEDPDQLNKQKCQMIVNHPDYQTILSYVKYVSERQDFKKICSLVTFLTEFYAKQDQQLAILNDTVLFCFQSVLNTVVTIKHDYTQDSVQKYISATLDLLLKAQKLISQFKEQLKLLFEQLNANKAQNAHQLQLLRKVCLADSELRALVSVDLQSLTVDDRIVMLKNEIQSNQEANNNEDVRNVLKSILVDLKASKMTINDVVSGFYEVFKSFSDILSEYYAEIPQITTFINAKQAIYCAMLFGVDTMSQILNKIQFYILIQKQEQGNVQDDFGDFANQSGIVEENDGFGDFRDFNASQQQTYVQVTYADFNVQLLNELQEILLPILSALLTVANSIMGGFLISIPSNEVFNACFPYVQTYIFNIQIDDGTVQNIITKIVSSLDALSNDGYQMYMQLLYNIYERYPNVSNAVIKQSNNTIVEILQNAINQNFIRQQQDSVGLKTNFF